MSVWGIVATVIGGWSLLSVLVGVVLGHAMSGRSLRTGMASVESAVGSVMGSAVDAVSAPVAMLNEALSGDEAVLDAAV